MSPAEQRAAALTALADAEAMKADALRSAEAAERTIRSLRALLTETALTMAPLAEPERTEWLPVKQAARALGIEPLAARRRAQRGLRTGRGRKVGGRLQLHMPSQPEPGDG